MYLKVIGSSSKGNAYILENETEALLIEAGCRFSLIKESLGYDISKVKGCIVSHCHNDHAKYVDVIKKSGIPVFGNEQISPSYVIEAKKGYKIGGYRFIPLPVEHDVQCFAYIVYHNDFGKLLFITDTICFNYSIGNLSHILIEANYCDDILERNIESGKIPYSLRNRIIKSHMEIGTTEYVLKSLDLSNVKNIILIHLSDNNSDADSFITRIMSITGHPVITASNGLSIRLDSYDYGN